MIACTLHDSVACTPKQHAGITFQTCTLAYQAALQDIILPKTMIFPALIPDTFDLATLLRSWAFFKT